MDSMNVAGQFHSPELQGHKPVLLGEVILLIIYLGFIIY